MVYLVDVNTNDPDSINYTITLLRGNTMLVTQELLKSSNVPDIGSIKFPQRVISKNQRISNKKNLRTQFLQNFYNIKNRNSNPGMTSYPNSTSNPCLD